MVRFGGRGYYLGAFHVIASQLPCLVPLTVIFVLICPLCTTGWKVGVTEQDTTCFLYIHETKTCFIQSHVNGRVELRLSLTPTSDADLTTPPHISWFRRVKLRHTHSLAVVNLLERGRPPKFMELSANRTDLTIKILSEYDMSRNSFKARVGRKGHGDHQNFVIESQPIDIEVPESGQSVAINTMDYFTIPGREAHFDWSKEGTHHMPRNAGISHDGKRLIIRHYIPARDSGIYICEVYSPADYFIAGRHFIIGSTAQATTDLSGRNLSMIDETYGQRDNSALLEKETSQAIFSWLQNKPDLNVEPLSIQEIVHTFKNNGEIYYVLRGRSHYLACLPSNMAAVDLTTLKPRYEWGRPENSDVISTFDTSRFLTVEGGILEIADVGPRDSGLLECNVTYHDVTGRPRLKTYTYGIKVYTLPDFMYSVSAAYTAEDCASSQRSAVFRQLLGAHLQASVIADDTSYEIRDFVAHCSNALRLPTVGTGSGLVRGGWLNLVHFDVVVRHTAVNECGMQCMVGEMDTKTTLIGMKLSAFFSQELEEAHYQSSRLIPNSLQFHLKYHCEGGYGLQASICVACPPGSFSQPASSECIQCPIGSYQPSYGAVDCVQCPAREYTFWSGSISSEQCQVKTILMWCMLVVFGTIAFAGLITACILYRYDKRHKKGATKNAPATVPKTYSVSKKTSRKIGTSKRQLSRSGIGSSAHDSELEGLLEASDDDDTTYVSDESEHLEDIGLYDSDERGGINEATNQDTVHSQLQDNEVLDHQQKGLPLDRLSHSQMVNELSPNKQYSASRSSLEYSHGALAHTESTTVQPVSSKVYSGMIYHQPPPGSHLTFLSHQAFTQDAEEAYLTHKNSSQIGNLMSPLHPQTSSPPQRQISFQEDSIQAERYQLPSVHDQFAGPSHVSSASSASLLTWGEPSLSSSGPSSPMSSPPSRKSDHNGSPVLSVDLSDDTDSETDIGSFIVAGENLPLSGEIRRSSVQMSKPRICPDRSSVAALVASFQSLSRSGPQINRSLDKSSFESTTTQSTKMSSISIRGKQSINETALASSPPRLPGTFSREKSLATFSSDRAPSEFVARQSPPVSLERIYSRTLTPPISPAVAATPVISPPLSAGALTEDLKQTLSRTVTLTQNELSIPPFSPPRTPQEVRSKALIPAHSKSFTPSSVLSEHSGPLSISSPPHPPSFQPKVSPKGSFMARRSSLMSSPAGKPTSSEFLAKRSPPVSLERIYCRTLTPPISPAMSAAPVISSPRSPGTVEDLRQTLSRTETITQNELSIPPLSPPRTLQEVRSKVLTSTPSKGSTPSSALSEHSGPLSISSPPHPLSVQPNVSSKESLMARRSSLMTSPAGKPANPFKLQRLRRQSLGGQKSSHLTATLSSTPHLETSSAEESAAPLAQSDAGTEPPSFPPIPMPPTAVSSFHTATPSAASPPIAAHPSIPTLPVAPPTFAPPAPLIGSPPPALSPHPSLVISPSSASVTVPSLPLGVPPLPPLNLSSDDLPGPSSVTTPLPGAPSAASAPPASQSSAALQPPVATTESVDAPPGGAIPAPPPPPPLPPLLKKD